MSKFLGFLLGVAVALAGPAVFGVLAAPGGIELNAKEMALAFGIGALIFWAVVSYFSGAGALGAFVAFGTLVYCWLWIPNRTTNFLHDVPGVTNGMIDGSKQYTLNGVVPVLGVISLVYSIQLIVRGVQRRRRERVEAERLQREQEAAQAQQEADVAAVYPVAGGTYQEPAPYQPHSSYDDLFDEPEPVQPRNQADEQTRQFPVGEGVEQTRQFPAAGAESNQSGEETVVAPAPAAEPQQEQSASDEHHEEPAAPAAATETPAPADPPAAAAPSPADPPAAAPVVEGAKGEQDSEPTQAAPVQAPTGEQEQATAAPVAEEPKAEHDEPTQVAPVQEQPPATAAETVQEPAAGEAPVEAKPVDAEGAGGQKAERGGGPRVRPEEQVGSQYRERMEDPEDTGEFFLSAFENPAVKPA